MFLCCPQEGHPDRPEIQKCMTAFKNLSVSFDIIMFINLINTEIWKVFLAHYISHTLTSHVILYIHSGVDCYQATIFFNPMFPWLQTQCQEVRKRKELELQILTETIRLWEGEDIKTFGSVIYMSQTMVQNQGCEVRNY